VHPRFKATIESLNPLFRALVEMPPLNKEPLPRDLPMQGIYLFSEGEEHLYVGRSNNVRNRYGQHCRLGSQHNQAVFAFKIARKETGNVKPVYKQGEGSRKALAADPNFDEAFQKAKERVRAMDFRCIEVRDQKQQTLLEIYCAIALDSTYNDFDTH